MKRYGKATIVHPTGTGKSYIAFERIEEEPEKDGRLMGKAG